VVKNIQFIYRLTAIAIKIPAGFLVENEELILKLMARQRTKNNQRNLEAKE
jgi:hypothetical protein